jgi:hypothetical protein
MCETVRGNLSFDTTISFVICFLGNIPQFFLTVHAVACLFWATVMLPVEAIRFRERVN